MRHLIASLLLFTACLPEDEMVDPEDGPAGRTDGLQVLYTFDEGSGLTVKDTSGVLPPIDLELDNLITNKWIPGGGIEITGPSVITSLDVAEKLFVACVTSNAITVELWVEPAMASQMGPATIFTYSKTNTRNFTIQQDTTRYRGNVLVSNPDPMATTGQMATLQTPINMAAVALQHIVYTRDVGGQNIYINGVDAIPPPMTPPPPPTMPPPQLDQNDWSPINQLAFANEVNGGRQWLGKIYMAAVYSKKLTPAEISAKYTAGH